MISNGINTTTSDVTSVMWIAGIGMILGLLIAIFITYRKPRNYKDVEIEGASKE